MDNNPFLVYIAQNNPILFSKLFDKYNFKTHLGNRTTKRYVLSQQDAILNNPEAYIHILKKNALIKKFGNCLKQILFKKDPKKSELYWKSLLQYYPKKYQFDIFKTTHNSIFHHKFEDDINMLTEDVLKIIPDAAEREKFAKMKLELGENEDFLKYVTPNYCLNNFKEKLNQMNTSDRAKYVSIATKCCTLNTDLNVLLKLLELIAVRFKNDDRKIRSDFLSTLYGFETGSILDKFNEQHWKFTMDIIATIKAREEWVFNERLIRRKYLEFLVNNNKPIRDTLTKYSDWLDQMEYESRFLKNAKSYKLTLIELIEIGYKEQNGEYQTALYDAHLAYCCKFYNESNPGDVIDVHNNPRIVKSAKFILSTPQPEGVYIAPVHSIGVEYLFSREETSEELNELKNLYFKSFDQFGSKTTLMWFLKYQPQVLQQNFQDFLNKSIDIWALDRKIIWQFIKKYDFLKLDQNAVQFFCNKLKDKDFKEKKKLVKLLAIVASPSVYVEFVKSFSPVSLTNNQVKEFRMIHYELIKYLHLINSPHLVILTVIDLCKNKFVKSALGPLYSTLQKIPENDARVFIEQINQFKQISVKKHAVNLSCLIYDSVTVHDCLKNASIPVLIPALKYFSKNPSVALWRIIELKLASDEKANLKFAIKTNLCPLYKSKLIELFWNQLDKKENNELKILLIEKIDKNVIQNLQPKFAYNVIEESLFKIKEANTFISNLLIHTNDDGKFDFCTKLLSQFKETCWQYKDTKRQARRNLFLFIQTLFETYMKLEEPKREFVNNFLSVFKSLFTISEAFEESVMVSFMKVKDESPENCSTFLLDLYKELLNSYGQVIISWLTGVVNDHVIAFLFKTETEKIKFCYSIFKHRPTVDVYLLVIGLLPLTKPEDNDNFVIYNEILTQLSIIEDDRVKLQFNLFLKREAPVTESPEIEFDSGPCICTA